MPIDENNKLRFKPSILLAWSMSAFILASGCSMPNSMLVRTGNEPAHQDDDVRFRTTYYFRVFDKCKADNKKFVSDTLYRFHMTGKADALFSEVHFESGTLHKSAIDRFGSDITYDKDSGKFKFTSSNSNENLEETSRNCLGGGVKRGFQIVGPQGLTTFDQDNRLILAMTSSGKPLISAMKELSGRMLNEQKQPIESATLSWLIEEFNIISKGWETLERLKQDENKKPNDIIEGVIKSLTTKEK